MKLEPHLAEKVNHLETWKYGGISNDWLIFFQFFSQMFDVIQAHL